MGLWALTPGVLPEREGGLWILTLARATKRKRNSRPVPVFYCVGCKVAVTLSAVADPGPQEGGAYRKSRFAIYRTPGQSPGTRQPDS